MSGAAVNSNKRKQRGKRMNFLCTASNHDKQHEFAITIYDGWNE